MSKINCSWSDSRSLSQPQLSCAEQISFLPLAVHFSANSGAFGAFPSSQCWGLNLKELNSLTPPTELRFQFSEMGHLFTIPLHSGMRERTNTRSKPASQRLKDKSSCPF